MFLRVVKHFAGLLTSITSNVPKLLARFLHTVRRAASRLGDLFILTQPLRFSAQSFRAGGHRFSAALCSLPCHTRALAYDIGDCKLLIQLARLASRRLLPFVELFLVISHPRSSTPLITRSTKTTKGKRIIKPVWVDNLLR